MIELVIDGITVKIDDEEQAVRLLARLRNNGTGPDAAALSPKQLEAYQVVMRHPNGAHYTAVAKELNLDAGVVNARLNSIVQRKDGLMRRCAAGTFIVGPPKC